MIRRFYYYPDLNHRSVTLSGFVFLLKKRGNQFPSLPSVAAVAPAVVVSRLDARERLLREARAEGSYSSESEEECELEEEMDRKRDRLTVVGSLVAADLVLTPCKVALFDRLGLTTLQRKKGECPGRSPVRKALPASAAEASISFLRRSFTLELKKFCF